MAKKTNATDLEVAPQETGEAPSTEATIDEPLPIEPTILPGHEGDALEMVTLTGNGPGDGTYRVAAPIPLVVASNGGRYVLSNRSEKAYIWQR